MPAAPTLSIGMPVYNGAKWLQESMALRDIEAGWRRDFGEVCGRLAG